MMGDLWESERVIALKCGCRIPPNSGDLAVVVDSNCGCC